MKTVTKFEAFTGETFDTEAECKAHEKANVHRRFVGLTQEQVDAALSRADVELADAFEVVGSKISRARIAEGNLKRERRAGVHEPAQSLEPQDGAEQESEAA